MHPIGGGGGHCGEPTMAAGRGRHAIYRARAESDVPAALLHLVVDFIVTEDHEAYRHNETDGTEEDGIGDLVESVALPVERARGTRGVQFIVGPADDGRDGAKERVTPNRQHHLASIPPHLVHAHLALSHSVIPTNKEKEGSELENLKYSH